MLDAFVQFTIGGNYKVELFDIPRKNKKFKLITGKKGYTEMTNVLENLNRMIMVHCLALWIGLGLPICGLGFKS